MNFHPEIPRDTQHWDPGRLSLEECLNHPWVTGQPMLPKTHLMPTAPVKWDARLQGVFRGVNLYLECVNMCQYMTKVCSKL